MDTDAAILCDCWNTVNFKIACIEPTDMDENDRIDDDDVERTLYL